MKPAIVAYLKKGGFALKAYPDQKSYFQDMFATLRAKEMVTDGFLEALNKREKDFPTGLQVNGYCIAIPHVEGEYILKEGIYVTIFPKEVEFYAMDNITKKLPVKISFLLLMKSSQQHMDILRQLAIIMQCKNLSSLANANSQAEFVKQIQCLIEEKREEEPV
ncbi:MAG: PTS sugar transporter subunit IIA [Erysipelotrichaceae bacterium]|jgi:PTS system galactitol-specific IIA component|nr:PTS sugar transporter subunit IIA [Erysipelotrichaceae bacterium]